MTLTNDNIPGLLGRFVCLEPSLRPELNRPFRQDGYLIATDTQSILRIPEDRYTGDKKYEENPKAPRCKMVIPTYWPEYTVDRMRIVTALRSLDLEPEADFDLCPFCEGNGDVVWSCVGEDGTQYSKLFPCPVCDGMNEVANGEGTYVEVDRKYVKTEQMIRLLRVMEKLEVDEVEVTVGHSILLFSFPEGVDVTVATCAEPKGAKKTSTLAMHRKEG